MNRIRVMHMVDSLAAAGRERVAVNLVNSLPRDRYVPYLCTTRYDGPLAKIVAGNVQRLRLGRVFRYDVRGVYRLINFIRENQIQILHAHDASIFLAAIAALFPPHPAIVWHDHFGLYATEERPVWLYRPVVGRVQAVITVNEPLAEWSRRRLHIPADRVWYIPNFVCSNESNGNHPSLPGCPGYRVVCVANLRAQKDHLTLLRATAIVVHEIPEVHVLLVGGTSEPEYRDLIRNEIVRQDLQRNVTLLGERDDVAAILKACDVGVLSSASEGLPLALLEYGMAGLPAVATEVGQCAEVLKHGRAGGLVQPGAADQLAKALISLLRSGERRAALGTELNRHVRENYSQDSVMKRICSVYETVFDHGSSQENPSVEQIATKTPQGIRKES